MKVLALLDGLAADWSTVKTCGILSHAPKCGADNMTCGKLLSHCVDKIDAFRTKIGIRLCIFKIGVTHNPLVRYRSYHENGYKTMWLLAMSCSIPLVHMLEAALICKYCLHVGCRNKKGTGGEGYLNRHDGPPGPFFVYIVGARADQHGWVG